MCIFRFISSNFSQRASRVNEDGVSTFGETSNFHVFRAHLIFAISDLPAIYVTQKYFIYYRIKWKMVRICHIFCTGEWERAPNVERMY